MNDFDEIADATNWLQNLGAVPFTIIACIVVGYVLRFIPAFPNRWIPLACVIVGPMTFCWVNPHASSLTKGAFYAHSIVGGLFLGMTAWLLHDKFIRELEDKLTLKFPAASIVLTSTAEDGTKHFTKPISPDVPADKPTTKTP